jgi:hypothetical protein
VFEWPTLGALVAVAVPIAIIFLVLGVFRVVQGQAERAVRSPKYWDEVPDGKRYPTGWGEERSDPEQGPGEPASGRSPEPDPPQEEDRPRGDASPEEGR